MKFVWGTLSLAIAAIGILLCRPDLTEYTSTLALSTPLAQIISMRFWIGAGLIFSALLLAIFAVVRRKLLNMGRIAGALAAMLAVCGVLQFGVMLERGLANPGKLGPDHGITATARGNGDITVLTYNTLGGKTTPGQIAQLAEANGADVIVLAETAGDRGHELVRLLAKRGLRFQHFDTATSKYDPEFRSTILLISETLGKYEQSDTAPAEAAAVSARPVAGNGPEIVGVHPIAPMPRFVDSWRKQTRAVYELCSRPNIIVAGDFNSTIDHQLAQGFTCGDGAKDAGSGAVGTWPVSTPAALSAPIDRVLYSGSFRGSDAAIVTVGGSDHRGLLVRLSPK